MGSATAATIAKSTAAPTTPPAPRRLGSTAPPRSPSGTTPTLTPSRKRPSPSATRTLPARKRPSPSAPSGATVRWRMTTSTTIGLTALSTSRPMLRTSSRPSGAANPSIDLPLSSSPYVFPLEAHLSSPVGPPHGAAAGFRQSPDDWARSPREARAANRGHRVYWHRVHWQQRRSATAMHRERRHRATHPLTPARFRDRMTDANRRP